MIIWVWILCGLNLLVGYRVGVQQDRYLQDLTSWPCLCEEGIAGSPVDRDRREVATRRLTADKKAFLDIGLEFRQVGNCLVN